VTKSIILHDRTREQVTQFAAQPSHALLLVGASGIGKATLAQQIVAEALGLTPESLAQHPYLRTVAPEKNSIGIEVIRELQHFLQLKTLGDKPLRRAIIIEQSNSLTTEAQNAFLKLLEEPPKDTLLVLTASTHRALLPTILSRVQMITVYTPDQHDLKTFFAEQGKDDRAIAQAYFLSGGLPGLMHALLQGETEHPLLTGVATAKELLGQSVFERLSIVDRLSKQKDEAAILLEALRRIAQVSLGQATQKADAARIKQWHRILKHVYAAEQAMATSANTKLVLTNVMLRL
jgi:hypothetical protein